MAGLHAVETPRAASLAWPEFAGGVAHELRERQGVLEFVVPIEPGDAAYRCVAAAAPASLEERVRDTAESECVE